MIRRHALVLWLVLGCLSSATTARAAVIGLTSPLSGNAAAGDVYTLTVSFDPNGSTAANLVSMELFLAFTGFAPVDGSYELGALFGQFTPDQRIDFSGLCADVFCSYPADDPLSPNHYVGFAAIFAPDAATGPGDLFSIKLSAASLTAWTLDLLGDDSSALFWDPVAATCSSDPDCVSSPLAIPFVVALASAVVDPGIARLNLSLQGPPTGPGGGTDPTPVPEPASMLLFGAGAAGLAAKLRRRN